MLTRAVHQVSDLKVGNPLANRILGRIQLKCPLHEQGCKWVGDYSELVPHLTSSEAHTAASPGKTAVAPTDRKAQAEILKQQGNQRFEAREWRHALNLYTKAIEMVPGEATFYSNRAAAHLMLNDFNKCVEDCKAALAIRPDFAKCHIRLAKAYLEMGRFDTAVDCVQNAHTNFPQQAALATELEKNTLILQWFQQGKAAYEAEPPDYPLAHTFFANMCGQTEAVIAQLWLARAELGLGRCDQVLRRTREIVKADRKNSKALAVRGRALFLTGDYEQAVKHLHEALRLDPDEQWASKPFKRIKRVRDSAGAARDAAFKRDFEQAVQLYTSAIDDADSPKHAPLTAQLHAERAKASLRLKEFDACLKDCQVAIYAQDDHVEAWLVKASALHALGRHQDAMNDMGELYQLYQSDERVQAAYNKAQFEVRKAKRPDYYAMLGIGVKSSESEIKLAYKAKALELHPDKQVGKSEEEVAQAEAQFKQLGDILEILTDPQRRKLYDEGYDKAAIEERIKAADKAARDYKKDGSSHGHHHHH